MYALLILKNESISDKLYYDSFDEAVADMEFYKDFYDSDYEYMIVKE